MNILNTLQGRDRTREIVRIRDNHICQDCGKVWVKGRRFDIHHLNGLCGKRSKAYDKVSDIKGLVTLCHKCHYNRPEHKCMNREWKGRVVDLNKYEDIKKMRQQRYTLREIGEKYGVSRERIRQILLIKV